MIKNDDEKKEVVRSNNQSFLLIYEVAFSFSVLNFLFNGFYKKTFSIAVDWTLVWFVASGVLLLVGTRLNLNFARRQRSLQIFAVLIAYLVWRIPDLSLEAFGTQKVLEAVFLGVPAFIFGMWIGLDGRRFKGLSWLMFLVASLISLLVTVSAILIGNVNTSNPFLDGGYQLTGAFVSCAILISCVLLTQPEWRTIIVLVGFQILGLAFIGSVPSFFSLVALMLIAAFTLYRKRRDRICVQRIFWALVWGWLLVLIFAILFGLPAALYRMVWKFDANFSKFSLYSEYVVPGGTITIFGKEIVKLLPLDMRANYIDRIELNSAALSDLRQAPIMGMGFGTFEHKGYRTPHNIILELGGEAGALAILIFCFYLNAIFHPLIKLIRERDSREHLLVLVLVFALAVHVLLLQMVGGYFIGRIQMFFCGLAIGVSMLSARNLSRAGSNSS